MYICIRKKIYVLQKFLNTFESQRLSLQIEPNFRFRFASGIFPANQLTENMAANEEVPVRQQEQNLEVIVKEVLNHPLILQCFEKQSKSCFVSGTIGITTAVRIALDFQFHWNCNSSQNT